MAEKEVVGLAGMFDDPNALIHAAETVRDAGYKKWDCHTPYPVHGLDAAMGLGESFLPYIVLAGGFTGIAAALGMQGWMSAIDYQVVIGGKELFSWPAFVPITFELFVLFSGFTITACFIIFCKLWRWNHPLHDNNIMAEVTCDRYAVVLEAGDDKFSEDKARSLLEKAGCSDIRTLFKTQNDDSFI